MTSPVPEMSSSSPSRTCVVCSEETKCQDRLCDVGTTSAWAAESLVEWTEGEARGVARADSALCADCRGAMETAWERAALLEEARRQVMDRWRKGHQEEGETKKKGRSRKSGGVRPTSVAAVDVEEETRCPVCGRSFSQRRYLQDHLRRVHDAALHRCSGCRRAFRRRLHLERHRAAAVGSACAVEVR